MAVGEPEQLRIPLDRTAAEDPQMGGQRPQQVPCQCLAQRDRPLIGSFIRCCRGSGAVTAFKIPEERGRRISPAESGKCGEVVHRAADRVGLCRPGIFPQVFTVDLSLQDGKQFAALNIDHRGTYRREADSFPRFLHGLFIHAVCQWADERFFFIGQFGRDAPQIGLQCDILGSDDLQPAALYLFAAVAVQDGIQRLAGNEVRLASADILRRFENDEIVAGEGFCFFVREQARLVQQGKLRSSGRIPRR